MERDESLRFGTECTLICADARFVPSPEAFGGCA
jgi:hypothetical protein